MTGWLPKSHELTNVMGFPRGGKVWFGNRPHDYIFDELGRAGFTVGVINFPTLIAPRAIGGVGGWMVVGWPYHPRVYPGTLEIPEDYYTDLADYGYRGIPKRRPEPHKDYHHMWWLHGVLTAEEYFDFVTRNQQKRIEIATDALPVDVLMIQCSVMDRAGHLLSNQKKYKSGAARPEYEHFLEIVDWSVAELLERFEPDFFAVVSDHGYERRGHAHDGVWCLRGPDVCPMRLDTDQENFMPTILDALSIEVKRDGASVLVRQSEQDRQVKVLEALGYLDPGVHGVQG